MCDAWQAIVVCCCWKLIPILADLYPSLETHFFSLVTTLRYNMPTPLKPLKPHAGPWVGLHEKLTLQLLRHVNAISGRHVSLFAQAPLARGGSDKRCLK